MDVLSVIKRSRLAFLLAFAAALVMLMISEGAYWRSVEALDNMEINAATRVTIREFQQGLLDAETGQRGYLLTHRREYLAPYAKGFAAVHVSLTQLGQHYADQTALSGELRELHRLSESKLAELARTIKLHDAGRTEEAMLLVLNNAGIDQMDALRSASDKFLEFEKTEVARARRDLYRTLMVNRVGVGTMCALGLLALFMFLRQNFALQMQREHIARVVEAERNRLEVEVVQRTMELTELTRHLQSAREDERSRLARNLHDDLGALLTSAKLDAARIKARLAGGDPRVLELMAHLVGNLNNGVALGRSIIENLRPSALNNLGLVSTLDILAREFAVQSGVQMHCTLQTVQLNAPAELMVYRLVQEALTNITKYAQAANVWIDMATDGGQVTVSVRDDGVGFDTSVQKKAAYGLLGMRFRVEAEGGVLMLTSAPGQGTLVRVTLPQSTNPADPAATGHDSGYDTVTH